MTSGGTRPVKSADRAVELLELLAASPGRRALGELARELEIPKSSLHGLLSTLVQRGWVELDSTRTRYGLGVQALRTGAAYLRTDRSVVRLTPVIDRLHRDLDTTVQLGRLVGGYMICLVSRETASVRPAIRAGWPAPAHATALGRVVLARLSREPVALLDTLPALALAPGVSAELENELTRTDDRGHAVDWSPEGPDGCCCVAVGAPPKLGPYDAVGVWVREALTPERASEIADVINATIHDGLTGRLDYS